MLIRSVSVVILAALTGCMRPVAVTNPALSPLAGLAEKHEGHAMHEGSWDRSGGNNDFRTLAPGQTLTIFEHSGPAVVHRFWVTIAPRSEMHLHRQLILRMYWDGQTTPAVEAPIGDFFGVGFGEQHDYVSLPLNETSGGYNCYFPMPFHKSARWTIENRSDRKVDAFYYNIDYTALDHPLDPSVRHFAAQFRRENPTSPDRNYTILSAHGAGHYVGAMLSMQALDPAQFDFFEGDEMITFNGAPLPQIKGTGTEDYFSSGWYFDHGLYSAPYHGVTIKDEARHRCSAFRWHIEDAMPFEKSINVTIEHGTNNIVKADYSSVAFYYLDRNTAVDPAPLPRDARDVLPSESVFSK